MASKKAEKVDEDEDEVSDSEEDAPRKKKGTRVASRDEDANGSDGKPRKGKAAAGGPIFLKRVEPSGYCRRVKWCLILNGQ